MTRPSLRPYQSDAIDEIRRELSRHRSTLAVLATGLGKTVVFAEIARLVADKGGRTLVIAHRGELLTQARSKLESLGVRVGVEKAGQSASDEPVVVASVQTLRGDRLKSWSPDAFRLIVIDEAHRAAAQSYRDIVAHFTGALVLGVTATPDRLDGQGMGEVFETCAYRYSMRDAIKDGWLVPLQAQRVIVDGLDLSKVRTVAGDLHQGQLDEAMRACVDGVTDPLLKLAGDRPTIVFGVSVAHAHALAHAINARRPGRACAVDGAANNESRSQAIEGFQAGHYQYLVNCALFTEGFDAPATSCIAIARPTKSRALYTQMVGRGTRLADGKADCLILDFAGLAGKHSLAGPVDVLASGAGDDVRDLAAQIMTERAIGLGEALDLAAERSVSDKRKRDRMALIDWWAEQVDPFISVPALGDQHEWTGPAATQAQRGYLEAKGLKLPEMLAGGKAAQLIGYLEKRRAEGLATFKQMRLLRRQGIDARSMTFGEAGEEISRFSQRWNQRRAS